MNTSNSKGFAGRRITRWVAAAILSTALAFGVEYLRCSHSDLPVLVNQSDTTGAAATLIKRLGKPDRRLRLGSGGASDLTIDLITVKRETLGSIQRNADLEVLFWRRTCFCRQTREALALVRRGDGRIVYFTGASTIWAAPLIVFGDRSDEPLPTERQSSHKLPPSG